MKSWRGMVRLRLRGLGVQIILWTVLPLTLVLIGVAFTGVYSHEQAMRTLVEERDEALAVVSAAQVRDLLRGHAARLRSLAAEQAFHHLDYAEQKTLLARVADDTAELPRTSDGLLLGQVALVDEEGHLVVAGVDSLAWLQDRIVPELARAVMARQDVAFVPLRDPPPAGTTFLMGVPVYDDQGITYGVLAASRSTSGRDHLPNGCPRVR